MKIGVGASFTAGIVGAMAPLFWWWTDAAQRSSHIQPSNFDISGFVAVVRALRLHARRGTRRTDSPQRLGVRRRVPIFASFALGVRLYIRPGLIPPTAVSVSAKTPVGASIGVSMRASYRSATPPHPGQTWSSNDQVIENCQGVRGTRRRFTASRTARR